MVVPKGKVIIVSIIIFFSFLFALPNLLSDSVLSKLPSFMPKDRMSLGLDLRGGCHLLLEVETGDIEANAVSQLESDIRRLLKTNGIKYNKIAIEDKIIICELKEKEDEALKLIRQSDEMIELNKKEGNFYAINFKQEAIEKKRKDIINKAIEVIRKRIDETGTKEPIIQKQGDNMILLQVPGFNDPVAVKNILGKVAMLSFHIVKNPKIIQFQEEAPIGYSYIEYKDKMGGFGYLLVKKQPDLTGDNLVDSGIGYGQNNEPNVSFRFDAKGAKKFARITRENRGKQLAIVLDNKIISAPSINDAILGGAGVISGNFSISEATELSLLLRAGALPAPVTVIEERVVGPDLGADSIKSGIRGTIIAVIAVMLFMILLYSWFGLVADFAVFINIVMLIAVLSVMQATLTLPGIAGIALSVGMAVDANVLINERIKEELKKGMSVELAVQNGYKMAMPTIIDTNLNTILGTIFLYAFGTGAIRGFAVTTAIGVIISFFTATTITDILARYLLGNKVIKLR